MHPVYERTQLVCPSGEYHPSGGVGAMTSVVLRCAGAVEVGPSQILLAKAKEDAVLLKARGFTGNVDDVAGNGPGIHCHGIHSRHGIG